MTDGWAQERGHWSGRHKGPDGARVGPVKIIKCRRWEPQTSDGTSEWGERGQEPAPPSLQPLLHPPSLLWKLSHPHPYYHLICIDTPPPAFQVPGLTPLRVQVPVLFEQLWLWGQPGPG